MTPERQEGSITGFASRLFHRRPDATQSLRDALEHAALAAEAGRRIGLFGARVAMQSGSLESFNESTEKGNKCGDWNLELLELPGMESRGAEVLEMCSAALRDIATAYAAAARAIKVTEAIRGTRLTV